MLENLQEQAFAGFTRDQGGTTFPPVQEAELIIQSQIALGLVHAVVAFVAVFREDGPDLVLEKFAIGGIVREQNERSHEGEGKSHG